MPDARRPGVAIRAAITGSTPKSDDLPRPFLQIFPQTFRRKITNTFRSRLLFSAHFSVAAAVWAAFNTEKPMGVIVFRELKEVAFMNARPEPDLRYFSKAIAVFSCGSAK